MLISSKPEDHCWEKWVLPSWAWMHCFCNAPFDQGRKAPNYLCRSGPNSQRDRCPTHNHMHTGRAWWYKPAQHIPALTALDLIISITCPQALKYNEKKSHERASMFTTRQMHCARDPNLIGSSRLWKPIQVLMVKKHTWDLNGINFATGTKLAMSCVTLQSVGIKWHSQWSRHLFEVVSTLRI